ncbi:peroxide stress protein YaaA [Anaerofilum sp. BX8]|uniref:UPF0246 protein H8S23_11475 n=1 Tax=Anaerofilum hominis TaxID=2763016 RepID=A0A923L1I8_9FIRM|nr:peroxide stress protein YaaA [Anaerofilum hominis]
MIAVISPAKNMRRASGVLPPTEPQFLPQTRQLLAELRGYSPWQLAHEMRINDALAQRAFADFADMDLSQPGTPALLSYHGLQYLNLAPETLSAEELLFLQEHLRIVSGFYGLLRPLDGIWPYRLELGGKLRFFGQNLYGYWGDALYRALFAPGETVINLSSGEYTKAFTPYLRAEDRFITVDFLEPKPGGKLAMRATAAKMARGRMARFIARRRAGDPEELKEFYWNGYRFAPALSTCARWAFVREPAGAE